MARGGAWIQQGMQSKLQEAISLLVLAIIIYTLSSISLPGGIDFKYLANLWPLIDAFSKLSGIASIIYVFNKRTWIKKEAYYALGSIIAMLLLMPIGGIDYWDLITALTIILIVTYRILT